MFNKQFVSFVTIALSVLSVSEQVLGRERWLERDNKVMFLHPRRFGQEHPAVIDQLGAACPGQVCGVLSGSAISTLLAASPECAQQDMADSIIDAAQQFDDTTKANMIALAITFRQAEKNTPLDFTTNPPTNRNSVFCQTAPKNAELNGLVQAQDPANDPNIFFDPATKKSVTLGSQANTFPFGSSGSGSASSAAPSAVDTSSTAILAVATDSATQSVVTASASATGSCSLVTITLGTSASTSSEASATSVATSTAVASNIGNFGSCTVPQIQFATGFDNRKETSFEPVDQTSYNHGSAQNIDIITQFICDTLTNSCGADQTAKNTCATAKTAADGQTAKTGAQADAFNAVFGITTNFASVAAVDDQGNVIAGSTGTVAASSAVASSTVVAVPTSSSAAAASTPAASTSSTSGNLQAFAGSLGATAPAVTDLGNGQFQVDGNSAFNSLQNALVRSCDVQHNQCANAANASGNSGALTVSACGDQQTQCNAQAATTAASA